MMTLGFSFILVLLVVGLVQVLFNSLTLTIAFKFFDPHLGKDDLISAFFRTILYFGIVYVLVFVAIVAGLTANSGLLLLLLMLGTLVAAFIILQKMFTLEIGQAVVVVLFYLFVNWFASGFLTRFVAGLLSVTI
jgi:hypothetical protein